MFKKLKIFIILFFLISCKNDDDAAPTTQLDSILSASVIFSHSSDTHQNFFSNPTKAYVSGYFYFEESLANDVLFGLDIEWFEGVNNPINFAGADWMAFVALTREGTVWIPQGLPENLNGTPNTDNWQILSINQTLQPNVWYKMTITANFNTLMFESLRVEGNGIDETLNLENIQLQYPNYASFDLPTLTFYAFAARSNDLNTTNTTSNGKVYFDDIEGSIYNNDAYEIVFENGFENQSDVLTIPITNNVIPLSSIQENQWYYENDNAKLSIETNIKRSGNKAMACNADLSI